ncbi:type II secretion system minor pseudopilin GspJ [Pantoea endophytica]|uniref:Type II secretion system protein J n=1 Tax=Pantoea sp. BJ2 TaxID=3141322 RepID=A0AAU7U3E4_9GAMM
MSRQHGFTLIEMLIALAIFSVISLTGFQLLQTTLRAQQVTQNQTLQLSELTRLFTLLEQDLLHALIMPAAVTRQQPAFRAGENQVVLQLTRRNWLNPLSERRASLQQVTWRTEGKSLVRSHLPEGTHIVHFEGIEHVQMRFFSAGKWQNKWTSHYSLPQAIDITIITSRWGAINRVLRLSHE